MNRRPLPRGREAATRPFCSVMAGSGSVTCNRHDWRCSDKSTAVYKRAAVRMRCPQARPKNSSKPMMIVAAAPIRARMRTVFEGDLVEAKVSTPATTSTTPITVSCPNFMQSPPYSGASRATGTLAARWQPLFPAITSRFPGDYSDHGFAQAARRRRKCGCRWRSSPVPPDPGRLQTPPGRRAPGRISLRCPLPDRCS